MLFLTVLFHPIVSARHKVVQPTSIRTSCNETDDCGVSQPRNLQCVVIADEEVSVEGEENEHRQSPKKNTSGEDELQWAHLIRLDRGQSLGLCIGNSLNFISRVSCLIGNSVEGRIAAGYVTAKEKPLTKPQLAQVPKWNQLLDAGGSGPFHEISWRVKSK
jgi:hypothetical protein